MVKVGDLVFARIKGYRIWPARVISQDVPRKYNVAFYGTYQHGTVKDNNIWLYRAETREMWGQPTGKPNSSFDKGTPMSCKKL